jgi:hypothetical protein
MNHAEQTAFARLLGVAKSDTSQSRAVGDFLLSLWNGQSCVAFDLKHHLWNIGDLMDRWGVEGDVAADMLTVLPLVERSGQRLDGWGYSAELKTIAHRWRPELVQPEGTA